MKTIEVNILNPKANVILKDMVKKNWIAIQKPSKSSFIELLGKYNISVFNYPASDLESDVRNA